MSIMIRAFDVRDDAVTWALSRRQAGLNPTVYGPEALQMYVDKAGAHSEIGLPFGQLYLVVSSPEAPLDF